MPSIHPTDELAHVYLCVKLLFLGLSYLLLLLIKTNVAFIMTNQKLNSFQSLKKYIDSMRQQAAAAGVETVAWDTIESDRKRFLDKLPAQSDVLVFGYGSLMWNPLITFKNKFHSRLNGYHRRFCLNMVLARGSVENPGVMMALDQGSFCDGVAFQLDQQDIDSETQKLWARECAFAGYKPTLTQVTVDGSIHPLPCIAFIINPASNRYLSDLETPEIVKRIVTASGTLGTNLEYFKNTCKELDKLGIKDKKYRFDCRAD